MRIHNLVTDTHPFLVHAPGPKESSTEYQRQNPLWLPIKAALFDSPAVSCVSPQILTFRTSPKPSIFEKSLARLGIKCDTLAVGVTNWTNAKKLHLAAQALQSVRDEFVLLADSSDVLLLHWPSDAIDRFLSYNVSAVFNAESVFWPDIPAFDRIKMLQDAGTPFRYLNAGVVFGRTKFLRRYYQHLSRIDVTSVQPSATMSAWEIQRSEQVRHMLAYENFKNEIAIDYHCRLFQVTVFQDWRTIEICESML